MTQVKHTFQLWYHIIQLSKSAWVSEYLYQVGTLELEQAFHYQITKKGLRGVKTNTRKDGGSWDGKLLEPHSSPAQHVSFLRG